jgi:hypothetical protein
MSIEFSSRESIKSDTFSVVLSAMNNTIDYSTEVIDDPSVGPCLLLRADPKVNSWAEVARIYLDSGFVIVSVSSMTRDDRKRLLENVSNTAGDYGVGLTWFEL